MTRTQQWERRKVVEASKTALDERLKKLSAHGWEKTESGAHPNGGVYAKIARPKRDRRRKRPQR